MKTKILIPVLLFILLISSCAAPSLSTPPEEIAEPALAQPTPTPGIEATPPSTAEPAAIKPVVPSPYVPFYVVTQVDNLVLRANPGPLFEAKTTLPNASRLLVLGRAPGGEWLLVQTPLERTGWVFGQFVTSEGNLSLVPFIQPADLQLVRGRVINQEGDPVTGIQFAVVQEQAGSPPRVDAVTDETGTFYAFMPLTTAGTWAVSFTAITCTSSVMDKDCNCLNGVCGGPAPGSLTITLPLEKDEPLLFSWQ